MVAQNEDDTQSHSGCVKRRGCAGRQKTYGRNDVSDSESVAAVCPPRISGFRGQPGFIRAGLTVAERHRARSLRALSGFFIDIAYEQDLLRQHEVIVFQHPLYTGAVRRCLRSGWIVC